MSVTLSYVNHVLFYLFYRYLTISGIWVKTLPIVISLVYYVESVETVKLHFVHKNPILDSEEKAREYTYLMGNSEIMKCPKRQDAGKNKP